MIAIYKNNVVVALVDVETWLLMTNASLQGTESEYVTCSLID